MYEKIGGYHVIRKAGSGGFSEVYEAYDSELDRIVAIKVCALSDPRQLLRFQREARILSRLQHPNVAGVYASGRDREVGLLFLVGEMLSGVDLERKIRDRDVLPPILRVRYLLEIASGLGYLHQHGLIHRDLSPANVRVLADHSIKLMDFGLAKAEFDATITEIDENFASIGYAPPEQMSRMKTVDHRVDIFAFGVIAYELLTYQHPFHANNLAAVSDRVRSEEPRALRSLWPACPESLAELVQRCLSKQPSGRPESCDEILAVLEQVAIELRSAGLEETVAGIAPAASFPGQRVFGDVEIDQLDLTTDRLSGSSQQGAGTRPVEIEAAGKGTAAGEIDATEVAELLGQPSARLPLTSTESTSPSGVKPPVVEPLVIEQPVVEQPVTESSAWGSSTAVDRPPTVVARPLGTSTAARAETSVLASTHPDRPLLTPSAAESPAAKLSAAELPAIDPSTSVGPASASTGVTTTVPATTVPATTVPATTASPLPGDQADSTSASVTGPSKLSQEARSSGSRWMPAVAAMALAAVVGWWWRGADEGPPGGAALAGPAPTSAAQEPAPGGSETLARDAPEGPASVDASPFVLVATLGGPSAEGSVLLSAQVPEVSFNHCYLVRQPAWSDGSVLRFETASCEPTFDYLDRHDLEERGYVYSLQLISSDGQVVAESEPTRFVFEAPPRGVTP